MTALVTGGTGFVGSAVVRKLLAEGASVRVLARPSSSLANLHDLKVETVQGDLRDPVSLRRALAGCDALFHVAADYRLWARQPRELYETNVEGTRALLRAAGDAGIPRIVYTSSVATLGHKEGDVPADEDTVATLREMIGDYKRSKFLAEAVALDFARSQGLPIVVVNPSAPVGPRDIRPTPTGRIILAAASGRMPGFVDTGLNLVHVDDVAEGHLLAYAQGRVGERYILGGRDMTLAEILARAAQIAGWRPPRLRIPHGVATIAAYAAEAWASVTDKEPFATVAGARMARRTMYFSSRKAETELGYHSRPSEEGIADAIAWFRSYGYL